jgi:hypothetical protein
MQAPSPRPTPIGPRGINGSRREWRFYFVCGISPVNVGHGYAPGMEGIVDGNRWVWCRVCTKVKFGVAADSHRQADPQLCKACYEQREEAARLDREERALRYVAPESGLHVSSAGANHRVKKLCEVM